MVSKNKKLNLNKIIAIAAVIIFAFVIINFLTNYLTNAGINNRIASIIAIVSMIILAVLVYIQRRRTRS